MPLPTALVGALVLGLLVLSPAPATAAGGSTTGKAGVLQEKREPSAVFKRSSYLCMGYQACAKAGMGNAGYAAANRTMYWRMYAGHNCTNYAAYRMVKSGLPNVRPWSGGGNAMYWGTSMPRITDGTPRIGAVAWWKANAGPAGSVGHVAYVEKVVSADQIVVSQDSWGGDFSWAVVTRSSGNWPSGFVHFNDVRLVNVTAPAVTGLPKVGSVLSATPGTWKPATTAVTYQWYAGGKPVTGAVNRTFRLTRALLDKQVTVATTASQLGYPARTATSAPTAPVQPGQLRNLTAPAISGVAQVDSTLTVATGTWNPAPTLSVTWLANGRPVPGATGTTLTLGPELVGRTITAAVTATRTGYDDVVVTTAPTAPVAPGTFTVDAPPTVQGEAVLGGTLTVDPGTHSPSDAGVNVAVQWFRGGRPVLNATGPTYQLTAADLGWRISARVTLSRPGYTTSTLVSAPTWRLRSDPRMAVGRVAGKYRLRVTVTVTAPGVAEVTGPVIARVAGVSKEVTLRHGVAIMTLRDLPQGKQTLTVIYPRSDTVRRMATTRVVRIG
jgi:surface antigen